VPVRAAGSRRPGGTMTDIFATGPIPNRRAGRHGGYRSRLLGIAGVIIAFLAMRRVGGRAALLGAGGAPPCWCWIRSSTSSGPRRSTSSTWTTPAPRASSNSFNNFFLLSDYALVTIAMVLLILAFWLRPPGRARHHAGCGPRRARATRPSAKPSQGYPAPNQGYPAANQGYPASGQSYPASGPPAQGYQPDPGLPRNPHQPGTRLPAPGRPQRARPTGLPRHPGLPVGPRRATRPAAPRRDIGAVDIQPFAWVPAPRRPNQARPEPPRADLAQRPVHSGLIPANQSVQDQIKLLRERSGQVEGRPARPPTTGSACRGTPP